MPATGIDRRHRKSPGNSPPRSGLPWCSARTVLYQPHRFKGGRSVMTAIAMQSSFSASVASLPGASGVAPAWLAVVPRCRCGWGVPGAAARRVAAGAACAGLPGPQVRLVGLRSARDLPRHRVRHNSCGCGCGCTLAAATRPSLSCTGTGAGSRRRGSAATRRPNSSGSGSPLAAPELLHRPRPGSPPARAALSHSRSTPGHCAPPTSRASRMAGQGHHPLSGQRS